MGTKFVGSHDVTLASGLKSGSGAGAWIAVEAEEYEIQLTASVTGGPKVVVIESDLGIVDGVQKIAEIVRFPTVTSDFVSHVVSLGSNPGGRRIRARWEVPAGSLTFADFQALETRTGL
jgi:hypothetical protein